MPIIFVTYNIRNGRNGGLEAALRGMSQANMNLGILQETKLLQKHCYLPCFKGHYGVHAEVNCTKGKRGGMGT